MSVLTKRSRPEIAKHQPPLATAGSMLVLLGPLIAIAGGRWGSYLGVAGTPIFFADLAVGLGLLLFLLSFLDKTKTRNPVPIPGALRFTSILLIAVLAIGIFSSPGLSVLAIRDSLPFIYLLLIPVFYKAWHSLGRERAFRWLSNAAIVHLAWFAPAVFGILPAVTVPIIAGAPLFTTRGDFDLMINGFSLVVIAMDRRLSGLVRWILGLIAVVAAVSNGSRAGLIAAALMIMTVALVQRPLSDRKKGAVRFALLSLAVAPAAFLALTLANDPPEWTIGLQKLLPNDSATYQTGQNTWQARINAWQLVIEHSSHEVSRVMFGFGFGSSPILESGAVRYLSGDPSVRAAHNFVVTWFAFVGLIGVGLAVICVIVWLVVSVKHAFISKGNNAVGLGLVVGTLAASVAGVILESPFGYMTLAVGVALACQPSPPAEELRTKSPQA